MNEVIKAMMERRSIRKFKPDMPPAELIDQIMEAGLYAASAMGKQSPIMIAVTNKELRDMIAADNCRIGGWEDGFDTFYGAPAFIIVLAPKDWPHRVYDGSLVMGNLMLAAHSLGLDSIWIHRAKEEFEMPKYRELLKRLGIEGEYEGIGHCAIGYRDCPAPLPPPRRPNRVFHAN
jgi:Nitroreductase